MRLQLILPALFLAATGTFTEAKSKTIGLTGSWKETQRFTDTKTPVAFTDTVRIDFLIGNEYVWQKDMGYAYRGTYKASETVLDMGARYFTVVEMKPGKMVVKNEAGSYEFSRYTKPAPAASSNNPIPRTNEVVAGGPIDKNLLAGKWQSFKRTSAVQQEKIDYTRMLKSIDITVANGKVAGAAYAAQRTPETGIWTIERYEDATLYCTGIDKRIFKVLQCANGELVLQEGNMTYFFKVF